MPVPASAIIMEDNIVEAFKNTLERKGNLDHIRASLRSEVFQCFQSALSHKKYGKNHDGVDQEQENLSSSTIVIEICHHLISEFLQCSGLIHTLSTFKAETKPSMMKRNDSDNVFKQFEAKVQSNIQDFEIFQNGKRIKDKDSKKSIPLLVKLIDLTQTEL